MIRRFLAASFLLACIALFAGGAARADDASHQQAAKELMALTGAGASTDQMVEATVAMQISSMPHLEPYRDIIHAFYAKYLGGQAMSDALGKIYTDNFTEQEIRDIIAFYKTPTGQKTLTLMPVLLQRGMELGQQRIGAHMDELRTAIEEAKKKREADLEQPPQ